MKNIKAVSTVDEYIKDFPKAVAVRLKQIRQVIKSAVPKGTEERIAYGIPTYSLNGNLVHFGGFKNHIGFYPAPRAIAAFKKELSAYNGAKGTVQFPLDKPLPTGLIKKIVAYRVRQNLAGTKQKRR